MLMLLSRRKEAALRLPENITLHELRYTCYQQRDLNEHLGSGALYIFKLDRAGDKTETNCISLCIPLFPLALIVRLQLKA
jgi:hypothetical protein